MISDTTRFIGGPGSLRLKERKRELSEAERMLREYVRDNQGRFAEVPGASLTDQEIEAVQRYSTGTYLPINISLRDHAGNFDFWGQGGQMLREQAALLESATSKTHTTQALTVHRGGASDKIANLEVGEEFTDPGFMSTSLTPHVARGFADNANQYHESGREYVARIEVPQGANVVPVSDIAGSKQDEVLLPAGTSFRVARRNDPGEGKPVELTLELTKQYKLSDGISLREYVRDNQGSDKILAAMLNAAQHGNEEGFRFLANRYWHLQPRDKEGKWTETGRGAGGLKARAIERVKGFGDKLRTEAPAAELTREQKRELRGNDLFKHVTGRDMNKDDPRQDRHDLMNAALKPDFKPSHYRGLNALALELDARQREKEPDVIWGDQYRRGKPRLIGKKNKFGKAVVADAERAEEAIKHRFPNLRSDWDGRISTEEDHRGAGYHGVALWSGVIGINPALEDHVPQRRRHVVTHEMLHMHSPGRARNPQTHMSTDRHLYGEMPGWEEAVVETNARIIAPDMMTEEERNGIEMLQQQRIEETHSYNRYIDPLETLRDAHHLGEHDEFWSSLMTVPLAERPNWVMQRGKQKVPKEVRYQFMEDLGHVDEILRNKRRR